VLLVAGLLALGAGVLAAGLSVKADLSHLLPPGARSVQDLDDVQRRAQAFGSLLVGIEADTPAAREAAARQLIPRLAALDPSLVARVISDDSSLRRFLWQNRYLYVPVDQLEQIQDELRRRLAKANPLFVDVSEDDKPAEAAAKEPDRMAELRARMDEAEARANKPTPLVSKDGRMQMIIIRATFPSADMTKSHQLQKLVQQAIADTRAAVPAGARMGASGDVITVTIEHDAILRGMTFASIITTIIVGLALLFYYRSLAAMAVLLSALAVGTAATFAFARLSVGYLNSATAFLISIVMGNGINFPILVVARYLEERRARVPNLEAVTRAWRGSMRGTAAAALTASVAYGSLIVTDFRGFRHFGIIGGVGMLLCWAAAYTVAPAGLAWLGRRGAFDRPAPEPAIGRWLAAALPRRTGWALAGIAVAATVVAVVAGRYIASDPFEYDLRQVRSSSDRAVEARTWQKKLDVAFGRGIAGGFVIAVDQRADASGVADELRGLKGAVGANHASQPLLARVSSLDDLVPADQGRRLELLGQIRRLIDRNVDKMPAKDADEARRLRPPEGLVPVRDQDVPADLALQFTEKDGQRGRLLFANSSTAVDGWDGRQLTALSRHVRALDLPEGTRVAGNAFVFADMVEVIRRDGPKATLVALAGVLVIITLTVGIGRHGLLTAACALLGTATMLALAHLAGLKVNFLDFVALPLTMGIGSDYAANVLSRAREEGRGGTRRALQTTGAAVFLCSFTTVVGYGSLLASDNAGIRSFGLAAILGEVTCMFVGGWVSLVALQAIERRLPARRVNPAAALGGLADDARPAHARAHAHDAR
jgi:uncharacterized protein